MLSDAAGWIAPAATMGAAMMTAANLGPRVTGWGFVVFTVGSIAWVGVGVATHQTNLILSNLVLTVVNLVGIWRWLGRLARYAEGGSRAQAASTPLEQPTLFPISQLEGATVLDRDGAVIGHMVDAMVECEQGRIGYLVVGMGGVGGAGERLHALSWDEGAMGERAFRTQLSADGITVRPVLDASRWPATREAAGVA